MEQVNQVVPSGPTEEVTFVMRQPCKYPEGRGKISMCKGPEVGPFLESVPIGEPERFCVPTMLHPKLPEDRAPLLGTSPLPISS